MTQAAVPARHLLESIDLPVEMVASRAGFSSVTTFRDRFRRRFGTSPRAYRQAFRATGDGNGQMRPSASIASATRA